MPKLTFKYPTSLKEYVDIVEAMRAVAKGPLWYRGCRLARYELRPTLYRHRRSRTIDDFAKLERSLINRFRQRSIPFNAKPIDEDWDTLFLMQHHGVPTRLLDWSENPFMAFFFAVMDPPQVKTAKGKTVFEGDAAVWILDPVAWNQHVLSNQSWTEGILSTDDSLLSGHKSLRMHPDMNNHSLAIYGAHNSQRIVAQRGVFTVFGKGTQPMEVDYEQSGFANHCLTKVILRKRNLRQMQTALAEYGITDSVVFPDLDGLAREIKRFYGFEV